MLRSSAGVHVKPCKRRTAKHAHRMRNVVLMVLFALVLVLYLLFAAERYIRPMVRRVIAYESREYAVLAFNEAVSAHITENPNAYENLFDVTYDGDGSVTSLTSNTYAINAIKSALTEQVMGMLSQTQNHPYPVRLGRLTGIQMLAGRGPYLDLTMQPESYVEATIYDTLEEAGNNQTKLNVYAHFSVTVNVTMAGYIEVLTVENDVLLVQNLFIGKVPDVNV